MESSANSPMEDMSYDLLCATPSTRRRSARPSTLSVLVHMAYAAGSFTLEPSTSPTPLHNQAPRHPHPTTPHQAPPLHATHPLHKSSTGPPPGPWTSAPFLLRLKRPQPLSQTFKIKTKTKTCTPPLDACPSSATYAELKVFIYLSWLIHIVTSICITLRT